MMTIHFKFKNILVSLALLASIASSYAGDSVSEKAKALLDDRLLNADTKRELEITANKLTTETQLEAFESALGKVPQLFRLSRFELGNILWFVDLSSQIENEAQKNIYIDIVNYSMTDSAPIIAGGIRQSQRYFMRVQNSLQAEAYETLVKSLTREDQLNVRSLSSGSLDRVPYSVMDAALGLKSSEELAQFKEITSGISWSELRKASYRSAITARLKSAGLIISGIEPKSIAERAQRVLHLALIDSTIKGKLEKIAANIKSEDQLEAFEASLDNFPESNKITAANYPAPNTTEILMGSRAVDDLVAFSESSLQIQNASQKRLYLNIVKESMYSDQEKIAAGIRKSKQYFLMVQNPAQEEAYLSIVNALSGGSGKGIRYFTPDTLSMLPLSVWTDALTMQNGAQLAKFKGAIEGLNLNDLDHPDYRRELKEKVRKAKLSTSPADTVHAACDLYL